MVHNLSELIASMDPELSSESYHFISLRDLDAVEGQSGLDLISAAWAMVREEECTGA